MKAYLHIYNIIRDSIISGAYPFMSKIPSKRDCAQEHKVSIVTVEHAYELLIQEGYIESRPKSGFVVIYRADDAFMDVENTDYPEIASGSGDEYGENEGIPFGTISKTMRKVLLDSSERILVKPEGAGSLILRNEICHYLRRSRGIPVTPEQIIIGAGAEYLYGMIVELLGRDRIFAIESPSYKKIEQVYSARGVQIEMLPIGHHGIASSALRDCHADVLHVTPYRSFPTGVTASVSKRREYISWASLENRILIEDDFESEFSLLRKPEETLFQMSGGRVIYVNTFSKTISPSFRTGYMVLPEDLIETYLEKAGFYSCTVPMFEQLVIAQLIRSGDFERHINRIRRKRRKEQGNKSGPAGL